MSFESRPPITVRGWSYTARSPVGSSTHRSMSVAAVFHSMITRMSRSSNARSRGSSGIFFLTERHELRQEHVGFHERDHLDSCVLVGHGVITISLSNSDRAAQVGARRGGFRIRRTLGERQRERTTRLWQVVRLLTGAFVQPDVRARRGRTAATDRPPSKQSPRWPRTDRALTTTFPRLRRRGLCGTTTRPRRNKTLATCRYELSSRASTRSISAGDASSSAFR